MVNRRPDLRDATSIRDTVSIKQQTVSLNFKKRT